ncbi:MAG: hypothetical protein UY55_C0005G0010 [Candidatus Jorgensenbacteria bacterium GW2011_GWB1_50_10]|uniref:Reversibly glycosylated polypeptide n=1 Tax=Candidatus Jorgensenbacteria bacterium GW2011_GWB1_50_10 TaxID=1618665 RepID=A0A0G1YI80_9BACT|nr:MAG: hypothetical protein UY55_C0005G0010 [Candidatus Jorgensenbacteria bacterium GW2011_GWB1_50_10]
MRLVLITTTIHVPNVLRSYRRFEPDMEILIAGDRKTPHDEVRVLANEIGNATYFSDKDQERAGYRCSEVMGWNKIMRRNFALLEAIRSHAEIIISIDDDNLPLSNKHITDFNSSLSTPFDGFKATSETGWVNAAEYLAPKVYYRGFPFTQRNIDHVPSMVTAENAKVGVANGLTLGDPDINAIDRILTRSMTYHASPILESGFVVDQKCFSPFDSQNTAFNRELSPLMMMLIGVGRYDDIFASYIAERIMWETDWHVHFGKPFVWQTRNQHNQWINLRDELFGMEYTEKFVEDLQTAELEKNDIIGNLQRVYDHLAKSDYLPQIVFDMARAWLEDLETVC